jgi:uncharacterized protein YdhG (YjbR/CyaY superfamily)
MATSAKKTTRGFSAEERAAMKERAAELKAAATKADGEAAVLAKIKEMSGSDRKMAERLHQVITSTAPDLVPRTYYGMPAYAKDDAVLCFFKAAAKFKTRYATLGFTDKARLDAGSMWPTDYALTELSAADEKKIVALVKKAVS